MNEIPLIERVRILERELDVLREVIKVLRMLADREEAVKEAVIGKV